MHRNFPGRTSHSKYNSHNHECKFTFITGFITYEIKDVYKYYRETFKNPTFFYSSEMGWGRGVCVFSVQSKMSKLGQKGLIPVPKISYEKKKALMIRWQKLCKISTKELIPKRQNVVFQKNSD